MSSGAERLREAVQAPRHLSERVEVDVLGRQRQPGVLPYLRVRLWKLLGSSGTGAGLGLVPWMALPWMTGSSTQPFS